MAGGGGGGRSSPRQVRAVNLRRAAVEKPSLHGRRPTGGASPARGQSRGEGASKARGRPPPPLFSASSSQRRRQPRIERRRPRQLGATYRHTTVCRLVWVPHDKADRTPQTALRRLHRVAAWGPRLTLLRAAAVPAHGRGRQRVVPSLPTQRQGGEGRRGGSRRSRGRRTQRQPRIGRNPPRKNRI